MSPAIQDATACREALSRLAELDLSELRQQWRSLYKADASLHLSRALLVRAIAYRMQEVALGGLRPAQQRRLRQYAQDFKETGETRRRARPELKPGTRLVLDDGLSWQGTHYRSLSALARKITGTPWSGPLFFGLKPSRSVPRRSSQLSGPMGEPTQDSNAPGLT
jgi:hypothetical protein